MSYASEKRWENLWYFPTDLMKLYRKVPTNPAKVKAVQDRKVRELMKICLLYTSGVHLHRLPDPFCL